MEDSISFVFSPVDRHSLISLRFTTLRLARFWGRFGKFVEDDMNKGMVIDLVTVVFYIGNIHIFGIDSLVDFCKFFNFSPNSTLFF